MEPKTKVTEECDVRMEVQADPEEDHLIRGCDTRCSLAVVPSREDVTGMGLSWSARML